MPFGLTNIGPTFQEVMEMSFKDVLDNFVLFYLGDITIFSKCAIDHFDQLRKVFVRCREYGVSLNPMKCVFETKHGKLL